MTDENPRARRPFLSRRGALAFGLAGLAAIAAGPALAQPPPWAGGGGRGQGGGNGNRGGGRWDDGGRGQGLGQGRGQGGGPGGGRGQGGGPGGHGNAGPSGGVAVRFTTTDITRIRSYYATRPYIQPQGLPPGIQRRLARGKPLPPGIAKRFAPPDLVGQLGLRSGLQVLVMGASIVLVDAATQVVYDITSHAIGLR
ncbi:MAG: hypothetical protein IT557_18745 [Alphaproteobacteria bacterium]|nr:hypothetical protein [Alphaproteobacteria bacterium]